MLEYQLQFDNDKFMISKSLYLLLFRDTNFITDYEQCRKYVRTAMSKYTKEVKQVKEFTKRKIDILI